MYYVCAEDEAKLTVVKLLKQFYKKSEVKH